MSCGARAALERGEVHLRFGIAIVSAVALILIMFLALGVAFAFAVCGMYEAVDAVVKVMLVLVAALAVCLYCIKGEASR